MELSLLILTQKGQRTYAQLEKDCGGTPSGKRIQQLATGTIKNFIDPPTVRSLARGLRVSEATVVLSCAESLGLKVNNALPRILAYLPAGVDDLTDEQMMAIANMVTAFTRERNAAAHDVPPRGTVTPIKPAPGPAGDESFEGPTPPLDVAADSTGEPSMKERGNERQDQAGEENQDLPAE